MELFIRDLILRGHETSEAISIKGSGKLLGIRCRCEGLSDRSRFVRLIPYADNQCLLHQLLSDLHSVPALHIDHVSGTDTPHWAVEARLIRLPWISPLGRWGVLQHDKKRAIWDYFAYNTSSVDTYFTDELKLYLKNPFDETVKLKLKILVRSGKNNTHLIGPPAYMHMLYFSYGIILNSGETKYLGSIEGPGEVNCFWIHFKISKPLFSSYRILGIVHRMLRIPPIPLTNLLRHVVMRFSKEDFIYETPVAELSIVDPTLIVNKLHEYYGLVLVPPDQVDFFVSLPVLRLPSGSVKISLKNKSQFQLKVWFNLWIRKRCKIQKS